MENKACKYCIHARTLLFNQNNKPFLSKYNNEKSGWCAKIEGLQFINLEKPDYSLPETDCKYFKKDLALINK